jgi:hypothetical protein
MEFLGQTRESAFQSFAKNHSCRRVNNRYRLPVTLITIFKEKRSIRRALLVVVLASCPLSTLNLKP